MRYLCLLVLLAAGCGSTKVRIYTGSQTVPAIEVEFTDVKSAVSRY